MRQEAEQGAVQSEALASTFHPSALLQPQRVPPPPRAPVSSPVNWGPITMTCKVRDSKETRWEAHLAPSEFPTHCSYPWSPHFTEEETEARTGQATLQPGVDKEQEPGCPARGPGSAAAAPDRGGGGPGFLAAMGWGSTVISGEPRS